MARAPSQRAHLSTQNVSVARRKAGVRGVPLPETVAACARQISTGESRSNNATQNTVKQPFYCRADRSAHIHLCAGGVRWKGRRMLWFCWDGWVSAYRLAANVFLQHVLSRAHTHTHTRTRECAACKCEGCLVTPAPQIDVFMLKFIFTSSTVFIHSFLFQCGRARRRLETLRLPSCCLQGCRQRLRLTKIQTNRKKPKAVAAPHTRGSCA